MIKKILAYAVLSLVVLVPFVSAQTGSITGSITDAQTGEGLPGATVFLPELSLGQSTNLDGEYTINNVPAGTHNVRVTYVGYVARTVSVTVTAGATTTLNVELQPDRLELRDLVVTGYGVMPRREVTGSIAQVRGEQIADLPVQTFDSAIQGRAAGVTITSASGQPGGALRVRVRGTGSITAGNDPLYVVDGVPVTVNTDVSTQASSNALAAIDPNDIESIEILKDAAAASIYGAQAANGVVLITTRRGQAGRTQFQVSSQVGVREAINKYDMLTGQEWVAMQIEGRRNDAIVNARRGIPTALNNPDTQENNFRNSALVRNELIDFPEFDSEAEARDFVNSLTLDEFLAFVPNYDWQDAIYRTGNTRNVSVSARGGTDQTRFFVSGSYEYQEAQIIMSNFERFNVRTNLDHRATDFFSIETSIALASTSQFGSISDGNFINGPFFAAPYSVPIQPIFNEDGTFNENVTGDYNIIQGVNLEKREGRTNQVIGNLAANFQLTPNLVLRSFVGIDYRNVRDTNVRPPEIPSFAGFGGQVFEANRDVANWNTNHTLSYFNTFDDIHSVSGVGGFEYRQQQRESFTATGRGFGSGLFGTLQSAADPFGVSGFFTEFRIAGFFGQVRYDYDKRYFATATMRYDGSSRFGDDTKWGLFYSGSLGWEISRERFLENVDWLDQLQLRVSYGVTGNSEIGNFASRSLFGSSGTYNGVSGLRASQLGNNRLTWEEASTLNLGLNWALLEGRFYGAVDVFRTSNDRLLLNDFLFSDSGFGSFVNNVGEVRNEGIEIEIGGTLVNWEGLRWTSDFNITFQRNEVIDLGDADFLFPTFADGVTRRVDVGQPLFAERLFRFAGINPADGRGMWYDRNGNITYSPVDEDADFVGAAFPDIIGGWNNTIAYAGFTLDVFFQYSLGQDSFKQQEGFFLDGTIFRGRGLTRRTLDRWQRPGDITDMPKASARQSEGGTDADFFFTPSTWHLEDVGYIRLKSASLSYQLPTNIVSQVGLSNARVFVQGLNLITWTNYRGLDPEIVEVANAPFPQPRIYSAGVTLQF
ncbi:TonB-linked outer membrane protein, SusC/RagA family [Cyclonatronum proteinivorum]|uniref:TonB-linked outer membrane protein, SusC/RagA family n=1 Tax=Cyclonatronum proteinivorum TaxID=1457365 RepID=A0A345UIB5_9BACT|nr:SusC/RagA family TonB-linked outer membrane protein [Cyclonatronum proteinivorum]AXJ00217.1 TonB-linked outer membrane protein, SusC/RagA family [Cyclonatronum proteinivorum]